MAWTVDHNIGQATGEVEIILSKHIAVYNSVQTGDSNYSNMHDVINKSIKYKDIENSFSYTNSKSCIKA